MLEKYSSSNPAYRLRPGFRFAFSAPSHAIALFFGAGCLRPGPGTWGSLAAALVFLLFETLIPASLLWVPGVLAFLIGVWAAGRTGDDLGVQDAGAIVIDEVAAVWLLLAVIPPGLLTAAAGFVDRKLHTGFGVMLDDLFAALWAWAALWAIARLTGLALV